ncbi:MAG: FliM/FliN family flagellar motor switch protein [Methyloversatilis sp.]|nr:FliM/FliN family flagellar motor switch protein [Methyloversatilis sp.]
MHEESKQPAPPAQIVALRELQATGAAGGNRLVQPGLSLVSGVKVKVEVLVGEAEMTIQELFDLRGDSVVVLDRLHDAPVSVRLDGKTIATGALVVVGDHFGVRIGDILPAQTAAE